jgi:heme/copper-type cytochrome/quinol oxidase subunit 2
MLYLYRKCPTLCFLEGEFNMRELLNSSVSIGLVFVVLVGCAISLVLLLKNKLKIQNNIKRFISFFLLFYSALTIIVFGVLFLISGRVA